MRKLALATEGGGVLGLGYLHVVSGIAGANEGGLEAFRFYAGTSAGGHLSVALWLGADVPFLTDMVTNTPWKSFTGSTVGAVLKVWRWPGIYWNKALFSMDYAEQWTKGYIERLGFNPEVTFREASALRDGRDCAIVALSVTEGTPKVFSAKTTPNVPVWKALMASQCIPLVWPPVEIDGHIYYDGGLVQNHPVDLLVERGFAPDECIGMRLDPEEEKPWRRQFPKTFTGILLRLFRILITHSNKSHVPETVWPNIIVVQTPADIGATDFDLTDDQKRRLLLSGKKAWLSYYFFKLLPKARKEGDVDG